jgi:DNA-binding transcriptional MerR regulator
VRTLRTSEAAAYLSVSPNTLRTWERRFGYPSPERSPGRHRLYALGELVALRDALRAGLAISSAVSAAREAVPTDMLTLVAPLGSFDAERADEVMETALALRSLERAVMLVLLPSLHEIERRRGRSSAAWALASRWAADWLARALRLAFAPREHGILIGHGGRDALDLDLTYTRVLELFCRRAGLRVLSLSVGGHMAVEEAVAAARPALLVLSGIRDRDDRTTRWTSAVRACAPRLPLAAYRCGPAAASIARALPPSPLAARGEVLELLRRPAGTVS